MDFFCHWSQNCNIPFLIVISEQNDQYFANHIFKCISMNKPFEYFDNMSLKYVCKDLIDKKIFISWGYGLVLSGNKP